MNPIPAAPPPSSNREKKPWPKWLLPAIAAAVLLLLAVVALIIVGVAGIAGYGYYSNQKTAQVPETRTPQKLQEDYPGWSQARQKLAEWNIPAAAVDSQRPGLWERWFKMPSDSLARKLLQQRLPSGYKIKEFALQDYEKEGEGYHLTYQVTLVAGEDQFLVPAQRYNPAAKSKTFLRYSPYLVFAGDLPAGLSYAGSNARKVFSANQNIPFTWQIPFVSKVEGAWQIADAEPLPFERNPVFESRALVEGGAKGTVLLRSETELSAAGQQAMLAVSDLDARIASIESESASYRETLMADLPSRGIDRRGASGSGTPTKAGIGTVAGAGTGALIGGLAGGGDGAAIGAGAGALAGLFGGYAVGRSDEKRAADRQNSIRNSAIRQAESQAASQKAGLYKELETELREKAEQHNAALLNRGNDLSIPAKSLN